MCLLDSLDDVDENDPGSGDDNESEPDTGSGEHDEPNKEKERVKIEAKKPCSCGKLIKDTRLQPIKGFF